MYIKDNIDFFFQRSFMKGKKADKNWHHIIYIKYKMKLALIMLVNTGKIGLGKTKEHVDLKTVEKLNTL